MGIKGPLTTPIGGGMRSLNVALRQELDLYVCRACAAHALCVCDLRNSMWAGRDAL